MGGFEVVPVPKESIDFLYDRLREAQEQFLTGKDGGLDGVSSALETVLLFLLSLEPVPGGPQLAPLGHLLTALRALRENKVPPLLTPRSRKGPPPASDEYNDMKGHAVFVLRRLIATGMPPPTARKAVAETLRKAGARPARKGFSAGGPSEITERTIRTWQEDIAADVGFRTTAAKGLAGRERVQLQEFLGSSPKSWQLLLWFNKPGNLDAFRQVEGWLAPFDEKLSQTSAVDLAAIRKDYLDRMGFVIARTLRVETT